MVVLGRLDPSPAKARYPIGEQIDFVPLAFYPTLARPGAALRAMPAAMREFWRVLGEVDAVWLLGPHPLAIVFAALAAVRGRRIVLGVRQDTRSYIRSRHPGRRLFQVAGWAMDSSFRLLARFCPVVVVGPDVAHSYRHARRVLEIVVSLIDDSGIVPPETASARAYEGELNVLSVGRLDAEKNPLLLAEVLAELDRDGRDWRLLVCGEGPLQPALEHRLQELGVGDRAELLGYVPFGPRLTELYRSAHVLLHVSWTEGFPQILVEAFAAALPVVATDVGGIRAAVGEAVRLVPPGDADAATAELRAVAGDPALRAALVGAGNHFVRGHTATAEAERVAAFICDPGSTQG